MGDLSTCGLKKSFGDVETLTNDPLFPHLREDVLRGIVFPAVRDEEIHFYHAGGRLCRYTSGSFYTNSSYLLGKTGR